jgi:protein transport protein SEC31
LREQLTDCCSPFGSFCRFCRLAWSAPFPGRPQGVLAAGMESGELVIYDPVKMLAGARFVALLLLSAPLLDLQLTLVGWDFSASEATIFQATKHKGPVRGLDFNGGKTKQILASGSSDGEVRRPSSYT